MTFHNFKALCEKRRSIRYFGSEPVTKDEIQNLLAVANLAPSVENLQPWHFHVILNHDMCKTLMKSSYYGNFVLGAGIFFVVTVNRSVVNKAKEPVWNEKELDYSCIAAVENMMLAGASMNLGSCLVSLQKGDVHEFLKLPAHETVVAGVMFGHYKKGEEEPSDGRQRKPVEGIYTFHE